MVGDDLELLERVDAVAVALSPGQLGVQLGQVALQHRPVDPGERGEPMRLQNTANRVSASSPRLTGGNSPTNRTTAANDHNWGTQPGDHQAARIDRGHRARRGTLTMTRHAQDGALSFVVGLGGRPGGVRQDAVEEGL